MWYRVDFNKLGKLSLPIDIRRPRIMAYLCALLSPVDNLHYIWQQFRAANIYKLEHTGQVCYLRGALNDSFDPDQRRIYIDGTGGDALKTYIYTPGEQQTKYLGKLYLRNSLEFVDTGADFLVYVPSELLVTQSFEIRALIDFYKLASKRYLIIEI